MGIFAENSHPDLAYNLHLHCATTFVEIIEKWNIIDKSLIAKGLIKILKEDKDKQYGDKSHYLNKNKNIANDGVIDTKHVQVANTSQAP